MKNNSLSNNQIINKQNEWAKLSQIIKQGNSRIKVSSKGGMILSWQVNGQEIIPKFHQKKNSNSYRGGMPICFPFFKESPKGMEITRPSQDDETDKTDK